jgi:ADP-ribose pyrophosphatase YjhB (NUDIX family)
MIRSEPTPAEAVETVSPIRAQAVVLVPVFRDRQGELRLVLVVRGSRGIHGGQLGLPGGKREDGDASLLETVLREAREEIGLARERIEILAPLEPLETRTSGICVHSFLARVTPPARWQLAGGEIIGVITPSVATVADRAGRQMREFTFPTWPRSRRVECVVLDDGMPLWGLTLRLLDCLLPRLLAGEWPI